MKMSRSRCLRALTFVEFNASVKRDAFVAEEPIDAFLVLIFLIPVALRRCREPTKGRESR